MKYIPLHAPQDTVSGYSFEESADTVAVTARPKPKTVSGILRLLPADATPGQQDSAVQAMMDIPPAIHLSTCPDTLYLPGLKGSPAHADIKKFDLRENYFSDKEYFHPELRVNQIGMAAEPITYRLNSDDYVTGLLLVSFFIVSLFIARNIGILVERIKNFFYFHVDGGDSSMSANPEVRGHIFLILQTCFTLAILFFDYTQLNLTEVFNQVSPYILLGMDTAICFAYFVIKIAAYKMVNWVFFDRVQNRKWLDSAHGYTSGTVAFCPCFACCLFRFVIQTSRNNGCFVSRNFQTFAIDKMQTNLFCIPIQRYPFNFVLLHPGIDTGASAMESISIFQRNFDSEHLKK